MEAGDEVDEEGEEEGDGEGPAGGGEDVGELDVELAVVVVDPAAGDDARVYAVEADYVGGAEEGVGHQAEHAGDGVFGEDVHGVVDAEPVFNFRGVLAWGVVIGWGMGEYIVTFSGIIAYDT